MRMIARRAMATAMAVALVTLSGFAHAGVITESPLTGKIKFTYDGLGLNPENVTKVEALNGAFTGSGVLGVPDYWNYGFNLSVSGLPGLAASGDLTTVAKPFDPADPDPDTAGITAAWTIDFYTDQLCGLPVDCTQADRDASVAAILSGARPRLHTILSGTIDDLELTLLGDGDLRSLGHLVVTDGIYHSVNSPNFVLNDPLVKALLGGLVGKDLTNVDLARFEFDSIFDFNFGTGGTATGDPTQAGFMLVLDSVSSTLAVVVPEPGTLAIFGLGLLGLGAVRRRRARSAAKA